MNIQPKQEPDCGCSCNCNQPKTKSGKVAKIIFVVVILAAVGIALTKIFSSN